MSTITEESEAVNSDYTLMRLISVELRIKQSTHNVGENVTGRNSY